MNKSLWLCAGLAVVITMAGCSAGASPPPADTAPVPLPGISATVAPAPTLTADLQSGVPALTPAPLVPSQPGVKTDKTLLPTSPAPLPIAPDLPDVVTRAKQALAANLGISVDSISVVAVIGQEFSTDAFNCRASKERTVKDPAPELILGQTILLIASGRRYEFHASDQTVIFCRPLP